MKKKRIIILVVAIAAALTLGVAIPFTVYGIRTAKINVDYSYLRNSTEHSSKVEVEGLDLVTQHVSCGYATIEMMSSFYGDKVSEDDLDRKNNGAVSTSSSKGFLNEINSCIPSKKFIMQSYLKNDILLKNIYSSLEKNNPVAIEWAAKYEGEWTLHFSIVTALDLKNDNVTIYNPYGYIENINVDEFISRTTFNAYAPMPIFLNFGFAYGAFARNTIFYVS